MLRRANVVVGAGVLLAVWLVVRPDLAGPQWTRGADLELWLALQAAGAVLVGLSAPDRNAAAGAVLLGWGLQILHFIALGEHYDDTLWGLGVGLMAVLAVAAMALARLVGGPSPRLRRRRRARGRGATPAG